MTAIPLTGVRILPGLEAPQVASQALSQKPESANPLSAEGVKKPDFMETLNSFVENVDELGNVADDAGKAFLNGEDIDLHEVMIAGEEAGIAFDLLLEIRNKLVEAYKDLIRMPI